MIKSIINLLMRTNQRNKIDFLFTVVAFSAGLLMFFLLLSHNYHHLSFDSFHEGDKKIYRVLSKANKEGGQLTKSVLSNGSVSNTILDLPDIKAVAELMPAKYGVQLTLDDYSFTEKRGFYVSESLNSVFDFVILYGNPITMFDNLNAIAITKSLALKYFKKTNVLGESIVLDDGFGPRNVVITGVYEDIPDNSHLKFDFLISGKFHKHWSYFSKSDNAYFLTYFKTVNNLSKHQLLQIASFYNQSVKNRSKITFENILDIHFSNNNEFDIAVVIDPLQIQILWFIMAGVLLMAAVNFTNINGAQAIDNSKMFSIQEMLGYSNVNAFLLLDSISKVIISVLLASVLYVLLEEQITILLGVQLSGGVLVFAGVTTISIALIIGVVSGLFSIIIRRKGHYLVVSKVIKEEKHVLAKSPILALEFFIALVFMIAALTVWKQLSFMEHKNLGYEKEQVIIINAPPGVDNEYFYQFTKGFHNLAYVKDYSVSQFSFYDEYSKINMTDNMKSTSSIVEWNMIDERYFSTLNIDFKSGRNFLSLLDTTGVILNEVAAALLSDQSGVGKKINTEFRFFDNTEFKVLGVIKDFHHNSFKKKISPVIYFMTPFKDFVGELSIKYESNTLDKLLPMLEELWEEKGLGSTFEYRLLKDIYEIQNKEENRLSVIANTSLVIVVVISIFGLFSFLRYYISNHLKELAIRRILGADNFSIFNHINKSIFQSLIVSCIFAIPLAYHLMKEWLDRYEYRTDLDWYIILLPMMGFSFILLCISLIQVNKVTSTNPSVIIKNE